MAAEGFRIVNKVPLRRHLGTLGMTPTVRGCVMSATGDYWVDIALAAMRSPTVMCHELADRLLVTPEETRAALEEGCAAISHDVLARFGLEDVAYGEDAVLAVAVLANKWPEMTHEALAELFGKCFGVRMNGCQVSEIIAARPELLRGPRSEVESVDTTHEDFRRAVYFANRWPEMSHGELAWELDVDKETIAEALYSHPALMGGKRAQMLEVSVNRRSWQRERARRIVDFALEHKDMSYGDIAEALHIRYDIVYTCIHKAEGRHRGINVRPQTSWERLPQWLELEDVLEYVVARDEGRPTELRRVARR